MAEKPAWHHLAWESRNLTEGLGMAARPEVSLQGGDLRVADAVDSHQAAAAVLTEDFEEARRGA